MPEPTLVTLKPSDTVTALVTCLDAFQPVCLWGAPGIGKSQIVQQTAAAQGLVCHDVRAVLLDPVDLRGLPHVNGDGRAHWAIPEFLPQQGSGVLFLDELNRAPTLVQNACFQLVLDRRLGEYVLPDGWRVVAASRAAHFPWLEEAPCTLQKFLRPRSGACIAWPERSADR